MKKDFAVLLLVLALSLCLLLMQRLGAGPAAYAVIRVDGDVYEKIPLKGDTLRLVETDRGSNLLSIENGSVCVQEADCPDLRCVRQGNISHAGAFIACVPHGLLITLEGGQSGIDAVSQ